MVSTAVGRQHARAPGYWRRTVRGWNDRSRSGAGTRLFENDGPQFVAELLIGLSLPIGAWVYLSLHSVSQSPETPVNWGDVMLATGLILGVIVVIAGFAAWLNRPWRQQDD